MIMTANEAGLTLAFDTTTGPIEIKHRLSLFKFKAVDILELRLISL